ncbi:MAG: heat-shock protein Hsp15 [Gemmatimonadetes bacterium]|nr:heat-shock protein Hsp15 [Gemmatimonadota bacterium]HCK10484.1 heat-shock protein Hsp15 [Candidatus Latescibacterota bacterium]
MRVDLYLKTICLMKRRSEAKRACDNGIVSIGGVQAKAAREVHAGDRIAIAFTDRYLDIEVLELPKGNIPKAQAREYYRVERDEERDALDF